MHDAIEGCKALVVANRDNASAYLALGLAYERTDQLSNAFDAFVDCASAGIRLLEVNENDRRSLGCFGARLPRSGPHH